ncbi:MAG: glycosyltransferase family 9 protein [Gemmataceae bacterium]
MRSKYPPLRNYEAKRIALIKPSALGDVLNALPVLTALRQRYPLAHIAWVVNRAFAPLLDGHPDLNETIAFDRHIKGLRGLGVLGSLLLTLRRQRFDLVIDLQGLLRSGLMSLATGARRRVGLTSAREGSRFCYTDVIDDASHFEGMHAVDRYWLVAEALGVGEDPKKFRLPQIEDSWRRWVHKLLVSCPRPWLAVAVGARWETKRWPPEHFAALLRRAQERFGGTAIFIGAGADVELAARTSALLHGPFVDVTGKTPALPALTALLSVVDVMISNDTGPLHLGRALGRPVVAPYTCTKVRRNGPYGGEAGAVEVDLWCQGSYLKRCDRLECMNLLGADQLWPALERTLLEWERTCRSA